MADAARPKLLVAWEGGENYGHIAKITELAHVLADNCDITVAAKDPGAFRRVSATARVRLVAAPFSSTKPGKGIPPLGFADNLRNIGWDDPLELAALVESWQTLIEVIAPDCMILQSAPTALLAHFGTGIPAFVMGTGYDVPPFQTGPVPFMHWNPKVDLAKVRQAEADMVARVRVAMGYLGREAPDSFARLFSDVTPMLSSVRELDHYRPLRPADPPVRFHGWFDRLEQKERAHWRNTRGKKIFAYLWPDARTFGAALKGMAEYAADHSLFLVAPGLPDQAAQACARRGIEFSRHPVDLDPMLAQADLFVSHGSHGTILSAMRQAVPNLCFPNHVEQIMLSHQVAQNGAGRAMVGAYQPADVAACVEECLRDPLAKEKAAALAQSLKNGGYKAEKTIPSVVLEQLLSST